MFHVCTSSCTVRAKEKLKDPDHLAKVAFEVNTRSRAVLGPLFWVDGSFNQFVLIFDFYVLARTASRRCPGESTGLGPVSAPGRGRHAEIQVWNYSHLVIHFGAGGASMLGRSQRSAFGRSDLHGLERGLFRGPN